VFGMEGVTNYIHLLGSGHMHYFLQKYGCLYLYRQQGWEAMMGKVQAVMHLNTQRGGKGSSEGKSKSFIYPIMLFVLVTYYGKLEMPESFLWTEKIMDRIK
jgi:hypothetical protein